MKTVGFSSRIATLCLTMVTRIKITLPDEAATRRLGAALARVLQPGDVVALDGDLGAGKTTLARGLIQSVLADDEPVPSPTFTLVQCYGDGEAIPLIWHFDLYRLTSPDELEELGWDDALASGIALVEWPERAGDRLPLETLWLNLAEQGKGRLAILSGPDEWANRLNTLSESMAA
jgi:tRNA threonylcarbamoyl adenosine modification protein YjeE